jgi:hypothetical protein
MSNLVLLVAIGLHQALLEPPHYNNLVLLFLYTPLALLAGGTIYHLTALLAWRKVIWPRNTGQNKVRAETSVSKLLETASRTLEQCWRSNPLVVWMLGKLLVPC